MIHKKWLLTTCKSCLLKMKQWQYMAIHVNGMAAQVHTRKPATEAKCHFRWKNTISKHIRFDNSSLGINDNFESAPVFSDHLRLFRNLKKNKTRSWSWTKQSSIILMTWSYVAMCVTQGRVNTNWNF